MNTIMNLVWTIVILAFVGNAQSQCLSENDASQTSSYSTDLSSTLDFSLNLYKHLSPPSSSKNFFFSPYSIWSVLTLAYFGSGGNTQRQLEVALRLPDKQSAMNLWRGLGNLYEKRQHNSSEYTFKLANRAYFDTGIQLRSCLKEFLSTEIQPLAFSDSTVSAKIINNFVSETTNGRIKEIVNPRDLTNALMVLVNAAFFKGTWKYQFNAIQTTQRDFHVSATETVPTTMMAQDGKFLYGESVELGARILELPYAGDDVSMFLLLPSELPENGKAPFTRMVNSLSGNTLRRAIGTGNLQLLDVEVLLPKFKSEVKVEDELVMALKNLGIKDLFDKSLANMTSFSPYGGMGVDKAIHKAFVEVNEEGTEAAAVTVLISTYSFSQRSEPILFHCNEPFVYIIYDQQTNNILFMGTFKDPRTS